jgi:hypothetical protein
MALRRAESIGPQLGRETFLAQIAEHAGRDVRPQKRGRKPRQVE